MMPPSAQPGPDVPRMSAAAALLATYVCMEAAGVTAVVSGPTFQRVLDLSNTQLGLCLGAMSWGVLITSGLAGHATARIGALRMLLGGLGVLILSTVLLAGGRHFVMIFAAMAGMGVGVACIHNAGLTLLSDIFPHNTRRVMALAAALWFAASIVCAPLVGAWLSRAEKLGWTYWSYAAPSLLAAALLCGCVVGVRLRLGWTARLHKPSADSPQAPAPPPSRSWMWIPALAFLHGLLILSFIQWATPMIRAAFQVDDFRGSLGYAAFALGLSSGRLLLMARPIIHDDRLLLGFSAITGGLLLALSLAMPVYPAALVAIAVGAFAASATAPCLFSLVAGKFPQAKSRIFGYQEASIALGGICGTLLMGLLRDADVPLRMAMLLSPLAGLAMGATSLIWRHVDRQPAPTPPAPATRIPPDSSEKQPANSSDNQHRETAA